MQITFHEERIKLHGLLCRSLINPSEVALLAGVSAEYYTRLKRRQTGDVSNTMLDAIGKVLRLDDVERSHLRRLARSATTGRRASDRSATAGIRPNCKYTIRPKWQ